MQSSGWAAWCCSGAELSENAGDLLILAWQVWWDVAMCVFLLLAPEHKGSSRWNHSINIFALLIYFFKQCTKSEKKKLCGCFKSLHLFKSEGNTASAKWLRYFLVYIHVPLIIQLSLQEWLNINKQTKKKTEYSQCH